MMRILLVFFFLLSKRSIWLVAAIDEPKDENAKQSIESSQAVTKEAEVTAEEPRNDNNQTVASDMKNIIDTRTAAASSATNSIISNSRFPQGFTKDTWAIAATTPLLPRTGNVLERQQVQRQTPYVHWTCFRQQPARPHDILQCCQEIYKVQESSSDLLCWKRDGCRSDKKGRSEFISYCSHHSVHLRHDGDESDSLSSSSHFSPQFTFVSAPEFSDLHFTKNAASVFRQLIAYSTTGGKQQEQWYYDVHSPLQLAIDPLSLFAEKDKQDNDAITSPTTFTAKFTSSILSDKDNDEDKRSLLQKLHIELPSSSGSAKKKSSWKVSLNIVLFLPEDIELIRGGEALSSCTSTCASSFQTCTIARGERVISTTSSSWMFDQQSVQFLSVTVENSETTNDNKDCELSWNVHLMVPDDDNILLPSPTIFNGTATVAVHHDDDDTPDETTAMLRFRASYAYALP
jgi:hypothetical protein